MTDLRTMTTAPATTTRRVAVLIPFDARSDEHRARAFEYVLDRYHRVHPEWPVVHGSAISDEWSKGAAVAELAARTDAEVLVIADADSFLEPPGVLAEAVRKVQWGEAAWAVPHTYVHRLAASSTEDLYSTGRLRLGKLARPAYVGPAGGGIVVVRRDAYELVDGIDPRFLGWGGEDLAFGYALDTLVGPHYRPDGGALVHLWHPHPAPDLRGSEASEELVAQYREARGFPRLMRELVARGPLPPPAELEEPVRFRLVNRYRNVVRVPGRRPIRAVDGVIVTTDADLADALRRHSDVREEPPR